MVATIAFACLRADGVAVRGVEFTPDRKPAFTSFASTQSAMSRSIAFRSKKAEPAAMGSSNISTSYARRPPALSSRCLASSDILRRAGSWMSRLASIASASVFTNFAGQAMAPLLSTTGMKRTRPPPRSTDWRM
jgi:hypothetical protein